VHFLPLKEDLVKEVLALLVEQLHCEDLVVKEDSGTAIKINDIVIWIK
jgi:hypothetical protein